MKEEIDAYKGCKLILFINIFYITISYLYALIRKEYNGDDRRRKHSTRKSNKEHYENLVG